MKKFLIFIFCLVSIDMLSIPSMNLSVFPDEGGNATPVLWADSITGRPRVGLKLVNDLNLAEHGRVSCFGQCNHPDYQNWNAGGFEAYNIRSPKLDSRICIIRMRGADYEPNTGGRMDLLTWNPKANQFNQGLRLDENGRVILGAGNGYPFPPPATAWTVLSHGNSEPSGAPLKFNRGELLKVPEDGAMEYDGTNLFFTVGSTRFKLTKTEKPIDAER